MHLVHTVLRRKRALGPPFGQGGSRTEGWHANREILTPWSRTRPLEELIKKTLHKFIRKNSRYGLPKKRLRTLARTHAGTSYRFDGIPTKFSFLMECLV